MASYIKSSMKIRQFLPFFISLFYKKPLLDHLLLDLWASSWINIPNSHSSSFLFTPPSSQRNRRT